MSAGNPVSSWDTSVGFRATHPCFSEPQFSHLLNRTTALVRQGLEQCQARSRRRELGGPHAPAPSGAAAPDALGPPMVAYGCRTNGKISGLKHVYYLVVPGI